MKSARELNQLAWGLRKEVLEMLAEAGSGHTASSLGLAEFMAVMYGHILRYDPNHPNWEGRDRLVMSNGHAVPIWYAVLAEFGFIPKKELASLRRLGSDLQGHPHTEYRESAIGKGLVPGIENTGGPLGQGVSVAVGKALGLKLKEVELRHGFGYLPRVFCLLSDAELQEGQVWEAFEFAIKRNLKNLVLVIDKNNIQIDAYVDQVVRLEPLAAKLESFGFNVREVDGNRVTELIDLFSDGRLYEGVSVVVMKTIPGKGVSFMENKWEWHGKVPNEEELEKALGEIDKHIIVSTHSQFSSAYSNLVVD